MRKSKFTDKQIVEILKIVEDDSKNQFEVFEDQLY